MIAFFFCIDYDTCYDDYPAFLFLFHLSVSFCLFMISFPLAWRRI